MSDPYKKLRAQIRAGRELLGMKQAELAAHLGFSLSKLSKAETGDTKSGNVLLEIKVGMEKLGVVFTTNGVEFSENHIEIIEGEHCYVRLLDKILIECSSNTELLIMFASDKVSPPDVNERYRALRARGVQMRQLIKEGDSYIMGELKEYRTIPKQYFSNIVTVIYDGMVAQVTGDETRIVVLHDVKFAERERLVFESFWDRGHQPKSSSADERF